MNWKLSQNDYTIRNALLWGNCLGHVKLAYARPCQEKFTHVTLAVLEALPILSQLVSLVEYVVQGRFPPQIPIPEQKKASNLQNLPVSKPKPPPIPTETVIQKEQETFLQAKRPYDLTFSKDRCEPLPVEIEDYLFIAQQMTGTQDVIQEIYQPLLVEIEKNFEKELKNGDKINLCNLKTIPEVLSPDKILRQFECGLTLGLARYPVKDPTAAVSSKTFYERAPFQDLVQKTHKSPYTTHPLAEKEIHVSPLALEIVQKQLKFHSLILDGLLRKGYIHQTMGVNGSLDRIKKTVSSLINKFRKK